MKRGRQTAVLGAEESVAIPPTCSESGTNGALAGGRAWTRPPHRFKQAAFSSEGANGSVGLMGLSRGVSGAAELVPPVPWLWWGCRSRTGQFALSAALTEGEQVGTGLGVTLTWMQPLGCTGLSNVTFLQSEGSRGVETRALPSPCARSPLSPLAPEQILVLSDHSALKTGESFPCRRAVALQGMGSCTARQLLPESITQREDNRDLRSVSSPK